MAKYNSGYMYNRKLSNKGLIYNSALHAVRNIFIDDSANGTDSVSSVQALVSISDDAESSDSIDTVGAFFVIDSNNVLHPLGVKVLRDSNLEMIPSTRDNTEEIPGMHGELDFGTEFKARNIELHVVTKNNYTPLEKAQLQRLFAMYLDPTKGTRTLIYSDDIEKMYNVKYSGKISPAMYATWFEFTLPFKMSNPFIMGSFEKSLTGSGTLTNAGTFQTSLTVEITGPVTNPSLVIGSDTLSYAGTIPSGQELVITSYDGSGTVKINGANAISGYNGVFPSLPPGDTNVTANSNITIRWRDCWL